jgi:hypothetical protein
LQESFKEAKSLDPQNVQMLRPTRLDMHTQNETYAYVYVYVHIPLEGRIM